MNSRRLILFLLLNIVISALVVWGSLLIYDRFVRPACPEGVGELSGVSILGVSRVGIPGSESLTLQNTGEKSIVLTGWVLQDSEGKAFTFPQLTIYPGGSVVVHTGEGESSVTDLYWGLSSSVWESGELVVLYDTRGMARTFYRIP